MEAFLVGVQHVWSHSVVGLHLVFSEAVPLGGCVILKTSLEGALYRHHDETDGWPKASLIQTS